MGKSKWHELKAKFNTEELEVPEPGEKVAPLETRRKRKRAQKEVSEASGAPVLEEVTSKAVDATPMDLTESPQARTSPREPVVEATPGGQVGPMPSSAEVHGEGSSSGVPRLAPSATTPPPLGAPRPRCIVQRFNVKHLISRLDHVSVSPDVTSLWSSSMTAKAFFKEDPTFRAIVDHWRRKWSRLQGELEKAKKDEAELQTLRRDLSKTRKSLEIALEANEVYTTDVGSLQEVAKVCKAEAEIARSWVLSLEENAVLKADLGEAAERRLCDEVLLAGREEEIGSLKMDLDVMTFEKRNLEKRLNETERAVVVEHRRGFAKAVRQARLLAGEVDLSAMHIDKGVRGGQLVNEDDLSESASEDTAA
ncbi:uncharacterized protein LOC114916993 isoform X2 [Cajanus cajan]|nr:uncharacterized protein LOC114916993 isoform X2 [Cajanus cajan]